MSTPTHQLIHLYTQNGTTLRLLSKHDEAIANYEELEAIARERGDRVLELAALLPQATVFSTYTSRFDPVKGEAVSKQTLALARGLDDKQAEARALWNLMLVKTFSGGDPVTAIQYGEQSLALARDHNLREQLAYTLSDISRVYFHSGRRTDAWSALEESRGLWRDLGNMPMLADNLQSSADFYFVGGEYDKSVDVAEEAIRVSRSARNTWGEAASLLVAAPGLLERGEVSKSIGYLEEALSLSDKEGVAVVAVIRPILAWTYGDLGDCSKGLEIVTSELDKLDASKSEVEDGALRGLLLGAAAYLHMLSGDRRNAEAHLADAEKLDPDTIMEYLGLSVAFRTLILGGVRLAYGDFARVLAIADGELSRMRKRNMLCYIPDVLRTRGEALCGLGRIEEAFASLAEARYEADRQGSRRSIWPVLAKLAELEEERGNAAEAKSLRREARSVIEYIAENADALGLRKAFMSTPRVRAVLDSTRC